MRDMAFDPNLPVPADGAFDRSHATPDEPHSIGIEEDTGCSIDGAPSVRIQRRPLAQSPLVTIAIPTFNRAGMVRDCVRSALAQTYAKIEVLVSDNASADDTVETLSRISDARLRVVSNAENLGAIANFNRCIEEARGEYIVLAADDNSFDPHFVEKSVSLIESEPGLPMVLGAYDILVLDEFSESGQRLVPARLTRKLSTGIWPGTEILKEYLHGRISAQLLSSLIRTDVLRRNGGFSGHPCAGDEATWIPALLEGRAGLVNEPCATYLVHRGAMTEGFTADRRLRDLCQVMDEISGLAEERVSDGATRRRIQKLTQRYVAYLAMINLLIYRRGGATLADAARKLWSWRPLLRRCTFLDFAATLRLRTLGRVLLPDFLVRWSAQLKLDRVL